MAEVQVAATCTWQQKGCALNKAVKIEITHEDIFVKPKLDAILSEERAVLLTAPAEGAGSVVPCELQLCIQPHYKIEALHCVCSADKIETFLGPQKEYTETMHGTLITGDDDDEDAPALQSYRYDIEIEKCGIVEMTLKFLTHTDEICIFGMLLQAAPNPNGVTTLLQGGASINMDNVQQMLAEKGQKLSPNAEKCKLFMEMYNKSTQGQNSINSVSPNSLLEHMKEVFSSKLHSTASADSQTVDKYELLQQHIDLQFEKLEARLNKRLDAIVEQQANILKMLQEKQT